MLVAGPCENSLWSSLGIYSPKKRTMWYFLIICERRASSCAVSMSEVQDASSLSYPIRISAGSVSACCRSLTKSRRRFLRGFMDWRVDSACLKVGFLVRGLRRLGSGLERLCGREDDMICVGYFC